MVKDEVMQRITEIGTGDDVTVIREALAQLADDIGADYDRYSDMEATNTKLVQDNETLREYNMKLFLRVGEEKNKEIVRQDETGLKHEEPVKIKESFEELFNAKRRI